MNAKITLFFLLQLYEIDDNPKRKEFLDDCFAFMQKRGEFTLFSFNETFFYF